MSSKLGPRDSLPLLPVLGSVRSFLERPRGPLDRIEISALGTESSTSTLFSRISSSRSLSRVDAVRTLVGVVRRQILVGGLEPRPRYDDRSVYYLREPWNRLSRGRDDHERLTRAGSSSPEVSGDSVRDRSVADRVRMTVVVLRVGGLPRLNGGSERA